MIEFMYIQELCKQTLDWKPMLSTFTLSAMNSLSMPMNERIKTKNENKTEILYVFDTIGTRFIKHWINTRHETQLHSI